jgi:nitroreductase
MLPFNHPVTEIIKQRYSCRAYTKTPIAAEQARQLGVFMESLKTSPLGTPFRFELVAAMEQDRKALRGLGTYGLIKDPAGFIIGAAGQGEKNLEDFGYGMEAAILCATGLGLGTCWLGGNFTKHSFSSKIKATPEEIVPAVASIGYATETGRARDLLRRQAKSDTRLPWETLFFQSGFENPLSPESAGAYIRPLEMLRLAPSASNHQPWRVVQDGACFHFYLQRTPGYGPGSPAFILFNIADLQRVDIGIAMCHFELAARELGLEGKWEVHEPALRKPGDTMEYVVTWVGKHNAQAPLER